MRKIFAALLLALLIPAGASALEIGMTQLNDAHSGSTIAVFSVEADAAQPLPDVQTQPDEAQLAISARIEERFAQSKALTAMARGSVRQTGSVWQDGKTASMALVWQGEQASGRDGCSAYGLTVDLQTGEEILLEQIFADVDGALAAMEAIITDDVLENMSDYMEYSDLLPMPTDNFSVSESGLTVYWDEDSYRYFDGTSGSVTFYWHELADYIGEDSPVYALSRTDGADAQTLPALIDGGALDVLEGVALGKTLGEAAALYRLADPDYTTDALVYPLERVRGFALEIPKYAETEEMETPVSAIRSSRISLGGALTTGKTTGDEIRMLLGEPEMEIIFDEDAAFDAMLEPGYSLFYVLEENVLELHMDEEGVLACVILRRAMPESLY